MRGNGPLSVVLCQFIHMLLTTKRSRQLLSIRKMSLFKTLPPTRPGRSSLELLTKKQALHIRPWSWSAPIGLSVRKRLHEQTLTKSCARCQHVRRLKCSVAKWASGLFRPQRRRFIQHFVLYRLDRSPRTEMLGRPGHENGRVSLLCAIIFRPRC